MSSLHAAGLHVTQQLWKCGLQGNSITTSIPWELDKRQKFSGAALHPLSQNFGVGLGDLFLWALQVISEAQWVLRTTGVDRLLCLKCTFSSSLSNSYTSLKRLPEEVSLDLWTYSLDHEYRTIHGHLCTHTALIRLPWVFYDPVLWWFVWKSFFFLRFFMWTIFKVFIEFVTILLLIVLF